MNILEADDVSNFVDVPEVDTQPSDDTKVNGPKGTDLIRSKGFWFIVKEDFKTHRKRFFSPGFQALFVYRYGTWVDKIKFKPLYLFFNVIWHLLYRVIRNFYGIEIEKTVKAGRRLELGHQHGIVIHANATIGDDVLIRHNVTFGMGNDWIPGKGPIIGDRVEFSPGVVVVGNVTIGDDVSVGPNCTITTNVPSNRTLFVPPPRIMPKSGPPPNLKQSIHSKS